jgi:hypothetical protein
VERVGDVVEDESDARRRAVGAAQVGGCEVAPVAEQGDGLLDALGRLTPASVATSRIVGRRVPLPDLENVSCSMSLSQTPVVQRIPVHRRALYQQYEKT